MRPAECRFYFANRRRYFNATFKSFGHGAVMVKTSPVTGCDKLNSSACNVTRVGEGPFPTEIKGAAGEELRARGNEYGAVTGRPRRCGWLDIPLLRYSNQVNGAEWLVVTKLDVLDTLAEIPICVGYEIDGKVTDEIPADVEGLEQVKPRYTTLKGWQEPTEGITEFEKLPRAAKEYLRFQERESGARIGMVSTGPDRDQTMVLDDFAAALDTIHA